MTREDDPWGSHNAFSRVSPRIFSSSVSRTQLQVPDEIYLVQPDATTQPEHQLYEISWSMSRMYTCYARVSLAPSRDSG